MPGWAKLVTCTLLPLIAACNGQAADERARRAADEIRRSLGNADEAALAQDVAPATVQRAQEWLRAVDEYSGAANGELDSVTLNAIEAFQRSAGMRDDGLLDEATLARLKAAAQARSSADPQS